MDVVRTLRLMAKQVKASQEPIVTEVSWSCDPYLVLISCMLSLRTKDETTRAASQRLFKVAKTPYKMVKLPLSRLQKIIYPVGFYRNKARAILESSRSIINEYAGKVPDTLEDLLSLQGVGRKTANLVLGLGYGIPAVCVDTHVHRISNRLGWVKTKDPHQTEEALKKIVPKKYWIDLNNELVTFGQNICVPISPHCSICYVRAMCKRAGVTRSR